MDNRFMKEKRSTVREAVGIFPDDDHVLKAMDELEQEMFPRHDISIAVGGEDMTKLYDGKVPHVDQVQDNPDAPRTVFVKPEEFGLAQAALVGCGALVGVFLAMVPVAYQGIMPHEATPGFIFGGVMGAAVGFAVSRILSRMRLRRIMRQRNQGGMVMWVSTPTIDKEHKASSIFRRNGARNVHIHQVVLREA